MKMFIMMVLLLNSTLFGKLLGVEDTHRTDIPFEQGNGQVTFDMVPDYYEMNGKEYYLSYEERIRIAQILNVVAIGETGLGDKYNTDGWNLRTGSHKNKNLENRSISSVMYHRTRNTAAGMFQIMRKQLIEECRIQHIDRRELFDKRMQVRIIVGRLIRFRGMLKFLRGEKSTYSFGRSLSFEFACVQDPKKKGFRGAYGKHKPRVAYARIKEIKDLPLYT